MYSLELPSGQILDMPPGLQFSFELQNSVFSGSDTSTLPGSFSFPVTLPETGLNAAAFGLPQLPTAARPVRTIEDVWVRAHGVRMFFGTLKLRKAGGGMEVSITAQPLTSTKTATLAGLDLGGERAYGANDTARNALMMDTLNNPQDHDFVFSEIFAPNFINPFLPDIPTIEQEWQNRYDPDTSSFFLNLGPVTPFPKLHYILEKLISPSGWGFSNDWQITDELRSLYFHSHVDITDAAGTTRFLPDTFDLTNHVPNLNGNDLLKYLGEMFCLGIFTNVFSRNIALVPLETVLTAAPAHDWTPYATGSPAIEYGDSDAPLLLQHAQLAFPIRGNIPQPKQYFGKVDDLPSFRTFADYHTANQAGSTDGFYWLEVPEMIYYTDRSTLPYRIYIVQHARMPIRLGDSPVLETHLQPLRTANFDAIATEYYYGGEFRGAGSYYAPGATSADLNFVKNDSDPSLFFYRGFRNRTAYNPTGLVPFSTPGDHLPDGSADNTVNHSLLWPGTNGLYNRSWKTWHNMLANGKPVTYNLLLPIHELTSFQFQDKIKILNMDYFVKALRVQKLTADGNFVVEAKLFSVI